MAHFVQHIVATVFAKITLHGGTPSGYGVLSHETSHPNGETRLRTQLAAAICEFVAAQSPGTSSDREVIEVQVFVLILWRYHNTQGAWEKMRPFVGSYCRGEITIFGLERQLGFWVDRMRANAGKLQPECASRWVLLCGGQAHLLLEDGSNDSQVQEQDSGGLDSG